MATSNTDRQDKEGRADPIIHIEARQLGVIKELVDPSELDGIVFHVLTGVRAECLICGGVFESVDAHMPSDLRIVRQWIDHPAEMSIALRGNHQTYPLTLWQVRAEGQKGDDKQ